MIQGIIYDKDGVIFDSESHYARTMIEVLGDVGVALTEQQYYDHWTRDGKGLVQLLADRGSHLDGVEAIRERRAQLLDCLFRESVPLIDGAVDMLEQLSMYPSALVTSSYRQVTDLKLSLSGLGRYFGHVITVEDVQRGKPDPEGFLLAARYLGIDPENLVVIEDAEKGIAAAHRAGMKSVAIPNKYTADNNFDLADRIVSSITDVTPELIVSL